MNSIRLVLTLIAYGLSTHFFIKQVECFVPIKKGIWVKITTYIGLFMIVNIVIYSEDIINVSYGLAGFFIIIFSCFKTEFIRKVSAVMVLYPIIIAINFIARDLTDKIFLILGKGRWSETLLELTMHYTTVLIWYFIYRFSHSKIESAGRFINSQTWFLIDAICLAPLISTILTIIYTPITDESTAYPIILACIVTSLSMIALLAYIVKSVKASFENQNLKLEYSYYKELEENQLELRKIRHDMNNHFEVIGALLHNSDLNSAKDYFHNLTASYDIRNHLFCSHSLLNAVLNAKYNLAISHNIDCFIHIDIDNLLPIEDVDICSLFANLMSNAIDASLK